MTLYVIRNKINDKEYVGATMRPIKARMANHWSCAYSGSKRDYPLYRAMRRYGRNNFLVKVLGTADSREELFRLEVETIRQRETKVPNGYNLSDGGEHRYGYRLPRKTRLKIQAKALGREISEETKAKISASLKGRPSPTKGMKFGHSWNHGLKHSSEVLSKMSKAHSGRNNWNARAFRMDGLYFGCVKEAMDALRLSRMQVIYRLTRSDNCKYLEPKRIMRRPN
jgi:group I intron endonuclease